MEGLYRLRNPVRRYAWGSYTAIASLQGRATPTREPEAELWLGAHPSAPSEVLFLGRWRSLLEVIEIHPAELLGTSTVRRFGTRLPFLLKVLAAERPLSIQAHPDATQARRGFESENAAGIPLDAPHRNYRDANHKPELLCALTDFEALVGFRHADAIVDLIERLPLRSLTAELAALREDATPNGVRRFFSDLLSLPLVRRQIVTSELVEAAAGTRERAEYAWIARLAQEHPGDIGLLAPILLNLVRLRPGQAVFLAAGQLHAYLGGVGIEIMANSDNVLRGGLTSKHVDPKELLHALTSVPGAPSLRAGIPVDPIESTYDAPAVEFELSVLNLHSNNSIERATNGGPEVLIAISGEAVLEPPTASEAIRLRRGESAFVAGSIEGYRIAGHGTVYRGRVGRGRT